MIRPVLIFPSLLLLSTAIGCKQPRTEAVVIVTASGLRVPDDIDGIHVQIYDAQQPAPALWDTSYPLCSASLSTGCVTLPFSMTLIPGVKNDSDSTRVVISAQRAQIDRIDDASIFTFAKGESLALDFVLYGNCLDKVDCAALNQVCGPNANCVNVVPTPFRGEPDLSATMMPGGGDDMGNDMSAGGDDMSAARDDMAHGHALVDMKKPNDLRMSMPDDLRKPNDLRMPDDPPPPDMTRVDLMPPCLPTCVAGSCASDNCGGICPCLTGTYCSGTTCLPACSGADCDMTIVDMTGTGPIM